MSSGVPGADASLSPRPKTCIIHSGDAPGCVMGPLWMRPLDHDMLNNQTRRIQSTIMYGDAEGHCSNTPEYSHLHDTLYQSAFLQRTYCTHPRPHSVRFRSCKQKRQTFWKAPVPLASSEDGKKRSCCPLRCLIRRRILRWVSRLTCVSWRTLYDVNVDKTPHPFSDVKCSPARCTTRYQRTDPLLITFSEGLAEFHTG